MGALAQSDQMAGGRLAEASWSKPAQGRRPRGTGRSKASWNILAEELVVFPASEAEGNRPAPKQRSEVPCPRPDEASRGHGTSVRRLGPRPSDEAVSALGHSVARPSTARAGNRRPQARSRRITSRPRGWQRLLPGTATVAVVVALWAGAGALSSLHHQAMAVPPAAVKVHGGYLYVVRRGDTLWSIASQMQPGGDPRPLVAELQRQLHGGELVPGDELKLP